MEEGWRTRSAQDQVACPLGIESNRLGLNTLIKWHALTKIDEDSVTTS